VKPQFPSARPTELVCPFQVAVLPPPICPSLVLILRLADK
jgi:hypothetical protein